LHSTTYYSWCKIWDLFICICFVPIIKEVSPHGVIYPGDEFLRCDPGSLTCMMFSFALKFCWPACLLFLIAHGTAVCVSRQGMQNSNLINGGVVNGNNYDRRGKKDRGESKCKVHDKIRLLVFSRLRIRNYCCR
ncbi:hypothetical protein DL89DRAFT_310187, partial [Linderina pennispora]